MCVELTHPFLKPHQFIHVFCESRVSSLTTDFSCHLYICPLLVGLGAWFSLLLVLAGWIAVSHIHTVTVTVGLLLTTSVPLSSGGAVWGTLRHPGSKLAGDKSRRTELLHFFSANQHSLFVCADVLDAL